MGDVAVVERTAIRKEDCWNVGALYPSLVSWEADFKQLSDPKESDSLLSFQGKLGRSAEVLAQFLSLYLSCQERLEKIYTYAHLRHDEDVAEDSHKQIYMRSVDLLHKFRGEMSWVEPEILSLSERQLDAYLRSPTLKQYQFFLEKIVRMKPHTLSSAEEKLVAFAAPAMDAASRSFRALANGDLKFRNALDSDGKEHPVTQGSYQVYLRSFDPLLRKEAFFSLHEGFLSYENTFAELLQGEVQKHQFEAKIRGFPSALAVALFPHNIDPQVYTSLIAATRKNLPLLHRYMNIRAKMMGVQKLYLWDLHLPLVKDGGRWSCEKVSYDEAVSLILESVLPLGKEYHQVLARGLTEDGWVDRYENLRKRTGAYSSGCFGSYPYILMNYHGQYRDMMTLAHEAGHSMHSYLSWSNQSYHDSQYPIFVAEVASTLNEELLFQSLLKGASSEEKKFLINQKLDDIRNTFFRQVMFAEFELLIHELVERGIPLTPSLLKKEYEKLNNDYFGPTVEIDPMISIEWARIPHFYYNFYVYQYATGIAAALSLVQEVLEGRADSYIEFLSSGGSRFPIDLLRKAGVDLSKPEAVSALFDQFSLLMDEFER